MNKKERSRTFDVLSYKSSSILDSFRSQFSSIQETSLEEILEVAPWLLDAKFSNAIIEIDNSNIVWKSGTWHGGTWKKGIWSDGVWNDGTWLGGTWESGDWFNGVWKDGVWECGNWLGGIWEYHLTNDHLSNNH